MAQANIHPKYFKTEITCITCSNHFVSGSTKGSEIRVDTCSKCHPFYTGKQTFVSAKGRVERFLNKASKKIESKPEQKITKSKPEQKKTKVVSLDSFKINTKAEKNK
ncbi:MAG: 50S ribosomal protein L31 [Spiroplasma sp.]